jgi:D-ribose pyranose/furanose isomerase RbsD
MFNKINALVLKHLTIKSLFKLKQEVKNEHIEIYREIITILDKKGRNHGKNYTIDDCMCIKTCEKYGLSHSQGCFFYSNLIMN